MSYRRALERLTTLPSQEIAAACAGTRIPALITQCVDELMELTALADDAMVDGRYMDYVLYTQEVSAWSETVQMLRIMADDPSLTVREAIGGVA